MAHKLRDTRAGTFHIWTHCVWAVPQLYKDDTDRLEFLRTLAQVTVTKGWTCIAYCLMTSHYHLIVEAGDGVLPTAMQVQFRRYGSRRIVGDDDLLGVFAYVANNPVEAGLCRSPAEWRWSSYAGSVGLAPLASFVDPARLLRCFDWLEGDPAAALRRRVEKP